MSPVGLRASTPGFERDVTVFEESEEVEILREETPMTVRESLPPSSPLTERDVDVDVDVIDVVEDVGDNGSGGGDEGGSGRRGGCLAQDREYVGYRSPSRCRR